jgi:hypothetical protein
MTGTYDEFYTRQRRIARIVLYALIVVGTVYPSSGYCQTVEAHDPDCSQITAKDKAYVALADEFLLPADAKYNTPSWRFDRVTPGIHWRENKAEFDDFATYRTGWTDGHVRFAGFGSLSGLNWLAYKTPTNVSPTQRRFKCSGYDLTPVDGPEGTTAYRGHREDKKDFLLIDDGNIEAICVTTARVDDLTLAKDPDKLQWCQFNRFIPVIEKLTPQ